MTCGVGARVRIPLLVALFASFLTSHLGAQARPAVGEAAATITPAVLRYHVMELGADSLRGRHVTSPALERTAQYVAAQFRAAGLRPGLPTGPGRGTWIHRYGLPGRMVRLSLPESRIVFSYRTAPRPGRGPAGTDSSGRARTRVVVSFDTAARIAVPRIPGGERRADELPVVLVTGRPSAAFLQQPSFARKVVLYLPPASLDSAGLDAMLERLYATTPGSIVLIDEDSATWSTKQVRAKAQQVEYIDRYREAGEGGQHWVVAVHLPVVRTLLNEFGVDLAAGRAATRPAARELPGLALELAHQIDWNSWWQNDKVAVKAPNVVGIVSGRGTGENEMCVVLAAPLAERGPAPHGADSSGAVDGGTVSLAGLLALAQAFGKLDKLPSYSVVFLATSGSAADERLWGSRAYGYLSGGAGGGGGACQAAITLTVDLSIGGPARGDTVVIGGLSDVSLAVSPTWLASSHPELGFTVADGGPVMRSRSDAAAFTGHLLPSLLVQRGALSDTAARASRPFDLEWATRLMQLTFYVGYDLATAARMPKMSGTMRDRLVSQPHGRRLPP